MGGCLFFVAILCFIIGLIQLFFPVQEPSASYPPRRQPATPYSSEVLRWPLFSQGIPASDKINPPRPQAAPVASSITSGGQMKMQSYPQKLTWVKLGQRIYTRHPVKGELMAHVLGRLQYSELWQQTRGPQSPWVPTGNVFQGFWLEGSLFLLNWQNRFYLLDESVQLSDADIQRDFLPHARKFAQSDQTADVYFDYPPAVWHIVDIGKFRVDSTEGEGLIFRPGAVGRFIHASGDSSRALVVEDYEGGSSGQDTVWIGYQIQEEDIKPA